MYGSTLNTSQLLAFDACRGLPFPVNSDQFKKKHVIISGSYCGGLATLFDEEQVEMYFGPWPGRQYKLFANEQELFYCVQPFDRLKEAIRWVDLGFSHQQIRDSLPCWEGL